MRELYSKDYYLQMTKKKKSLLTLYFSILAFVVLIITAIMIIYANEPYGTKLRVPLMIIMISITVIFIAYSFLFFTITYGRLKKYCFYLYYTVFGSRETAKVTVLDYSLTPKDNGGIDFYSLNVLIWSNAYNDYVERIIYVDCEFSIDDISVNDVLTVVLNSNYLVAYKKETK